MCLGVYSRMDFEKDMFLKEIGLRPLNMLTILGSIVNMIGGFIGPLNEHENLHLVMNKMFI